MLDVHVLGAGSGLPTARRDTTALLVLAQGLPILVDCPGSVVQRLARLGVAPGDIAAIILTHDHVDHLYGLPHLVHAATIAGVEAPIELFAPADTIATARRVLDAHGMLDDRYVQLECRPIGGVPREPVLARDGLSVCASPTAHGRDTRALRFEVENASFAHSSDTRPHEPLGELFEQVDLLTHDCAGLHRDRDRFAANHSSAAEAGRIAAGAGVAELRLIHLAPEAESDEAALVSEAESEFGGRVAVARDGDLYRLPRPGSPGEREGDRAVG